MRMLKKHTDMLSAIVEEDELKILKSAIGEEGVQGWSVFDANGVEHASDGMTDTVTAVCSNVLDLAATVGEELGETDPKPEVTFLKGPRELHTTPLSNANLLIVSDKRGGFRKESMNVS